MKFIGADDKLMAKVNKTRDRIKELDRELAELETASPPREDIEYRVDQFIERLLERSDIKRNLVGSLLSPDNRNLTYFPNYSYGGEGHPPFNFLELSLEIQAVVNPESLKTRLVALADQELDHREPGPPLADRPEIRRKLEAERQKLELTEEKEIEKLEADGWLVHRRPDARPEIILNEVTT